MGAGACESTYDGLIVGDEPDGAHAHVSEQVALNIQAAGIDTRNAQRDAYLRSNDFLALGRFQVITFTSSDVRQTSPESPELTKDLTIKGRHPLGSPSGSRFRPSGTPESTDPVLVELRKISRSACS